MPRDSTQTGRVSTLTLAILVALGVIVLLASAEYAIPRWLHPGPGDSGSFFSSNDSALGPSDPASRAAPSIRPSPGSDAVHSSGRPEKKGAATRKPPAEAGTLSRVAPPSGPQVSAEPQDAIRPSRSPEEARAAEENLRATEDATAHLVALEREELDRLFDRARAMKDRIEAVQSQQPAQGQQRETLAFSQQRIQQDLMQADAALKTADVQKAKIYLDLAKGELEKISKVLARL